MNLTVLIPAHNEEGCIESTVQAVSGALTAAGISHEILIVNDNSTDATENILARLSAANSSVRYVNNPPPHGYGLAVRKGLELFRGDAVAIYMADASDSPEDLIRFYRKMEEGFDCVFGSRWIKGGYVRDYPLLKRVLNRLGNQFIRLLFHIRYDDVTNAFKLFRRHVIRGCAPLFSHHYNLTVELPLKSIVRGYRYTVIPNGWINRKTGQSNWDIQEMGSRYLFIIFYCLLEKWLSQNDYHSSRREKNDADA